MSPRTPGQGLPLHPLQAPNLATSPGSAPRSRAAARSGGRLEAFRVVRPYGLGVEIVLRTADPGRFLRNNVRAFDAATTAMLDRIEGSYLELRDGRGAAYIAASEDRWHAGSGWARPSLMGCLNTFGFAAESSSPPPCPD